MNSVLFDLDGTLTNSAPGIVACIQHAVRELGRDVPEADRLGWCIGPPLEGSFATLLASQDSALLTQALSHYRTRFTAIGYAENALYDGVLDALHELRSLGYHTFVATAKPEPYALKIVEHFAIRALFDGVYGSDLSGARSDKTELIAHVMAAERLAPSSAIMVGDRGYDMIGARNCGIACIGVAYGYGTEEELRSGGAADIAASPGDIVRLVQRYLES